MLLRGSDFWRCAAKAEWQCTSPQDHMDIQNARVRIQWIVLDVYSNYSSWGAETARAIFSIEETLAQLYRSKVQPKPGSLFAHIHWMRHLCCLTVWLFDMLRPHGTFGAWVLRILHWMSSGLLKGQTMQCPELVPIPPESQDILPHNLPITIRSTINTCIILAVHLPFLQNMDF